MCIGTVISLHVGFCNWYNSLLQLSNISVLPFTAAVLHSCHSFFVEAVRSTAGLRLYDFYLTILTA